MLYKNIKQSIDALTVFTRLEDKLYVGECILKNVREFPSFEGHRYELIINIDYLGSIITVHLYDSGVLSIYGELTPKHYEQQLTDDEFIIVKTRIIKIAQRQQDSFENLLRGSDNINEIDVF